MASPSVSPEPGVDNAGAESDTKIQMAPVLKTVCIVLFELSDVLVLICTGVFPIQVDPAELPKFSFLNQVGSSLPS